MLNLSRRISLTCWFESGSKVLPAKLDILVRIKFLVLVIIACLHVSLTTCKILTSYKAIIASACNRCEFQRAFSSLWFLLEAY